MTITLHNYHKQSICKVTTGGKHTIPPTQPLRSLRGDPHSWVSGYQKEFASIAMYTWHIITQLFLTYRHPSTHNSYHHTHTHTHTCTHTHMHTHTHTHSLRRTAQTNVQSTTNRQTNNQNKQSKQTDKQTHKHTHASKRGPSDDRRGYGQ